MDERARADELSPDEEDSGPGRLVLPTFWGLALILTVAAYTVVQAFDAGRTSATPGTSGRQLQAVAPQPTPSTSPFRFAYVPGADQVPITVYLACGMQDGRDATQYQPPRGGHVILGISTDYDEIVRFMDGSSDRYASNAFTVQTSCFRQQLESGQFPSRGSGEGAVVPVRPANALLSLGPA